MSWEDFWTTSLDRLHAYWQAYQYTREARNQELWLQGVYIRSAIASCFDNKNKYPDRPIRITEMTEAEKAEDKKRRVELIRQQLDEIKRRSDAKREVKRSNGNDNG